MKIGIYGGSFNPPHKGHLKLADEISEKKGLERVIIIPSNISPQKDNNGNIDPSHRINMCRMVFTDTKYRVSDCEIRRGGKSYTVETLGQLREKYPEGEFYLFMGSDMLLSFHTWYKYREILEMCTLCAVSRNSEDDTGKMREYAESVLKTDKVQIIEIEPLEISSSEIRERIHQGKELEKFLNSDVIKYIKENKLYG